MLDYWTSGHYAGGAGCNIPAGQDWNKVVGPIFVYFNALENPETPTPGRSRHARGHGRAIPPSRPPGTTTPSPFGNDALDKAKEVKAAVAL